MKLCSGRPRRHFSFSQQGSLIRTFSPMYSRWCRCLLPIYLPLIPFPTFMGSGSGTNRLVTPAASFKGELPVPLRSGSASRELSNAECELCEDVSPPLFLRGYRFCFCTGLPRHSRCISVATQFAYWCEALSGGRLFLGILQLFLLRCSRPTGVASLYSYFFVRHPP